MAVDLTSQVLDLLSTNDSILSTEAFPSVPSTVVKSSLDRLASREMVSYQTTDRELAVLTEEAKGIEADGSHEAKVFEAVRKAVEGLKIGDLPVRQRQCQMRHECCCITTDVISRVLSEKRAPKSVKARLSRRAGSRRTRKGYC